MSRLFFFVIIIIIIIVVSVAEHLSLHEIRKRPMLPNEASRPKMNPKICDITERSVYGINRSGIKCDSEIALTDRVEEKYLTG